jgi:hypothetical protein
MSESKNNSMNQIKFIRMSLLALPLFFLTLVQCQPKTDDPVLNEEGYVKTGVEFETTDTFLLNLYRAAEKVCAGNIRNFAGRNVLIEGGGYNGVWIETQPMGGEMYAKRNITPGMNNMLYLIEFQHENGRMPGLVGFENDKPHAVWTCMGDIYFPFPALNMYYWNKKRDKAFLQKVYDAFERFDEYRWRYRDSDGDGCLETWCVWDTGEDNSLRFAGTQLNSGGWIGETPPDDPVFPVESMDYMANSYDMRMTMARISELLGLGKEKELREKAKAVQDKIIDYLWDESRGACFDRDRENRTMPTLVHNNLRLMYHNALTQEMADRFVQEHLLNPDEFWTPFPLPSIAVNDPIFRNGVDNDWGGPPMGLTYQRAIHALENYGYYSIITALGEKLLDNVGQKNFFSQQFDPFTGEFGTVDWRRDYGPTALSVLEYISRLYGIHVQEDEIWWGCLGKTYTYTQHWGGDDYKIVSENGSAKGFFNGKEIFNVSNGLRVVTDYGGKVLKIINITNEPKQIEYHANGKKGIIKEVQPDDIIVP